MQLHLYIQYFFYMCLAGSRGGEGGKRVFEEKSSWESSAWQTGKNEGSDVGTDQEVVCIR